jgi:hypothetical protein
MTIRLTGIVWGGDDWDNAYETSASRSVLRAG